MILFSNGCSFLTPRPKDNVNTFVTKELSESYNLDLVNLAMGGRGNTRVEFSTKVWVEQNENEKILAIIFTKKGGSCVFEITFKASDLAIFLANFSNIIIFFTIKFSTQSE